MEYTTTTSPSTYRTLSSSMPPGDTSTTTKDHLYPHHHHYTPSLPTPLQLTFHYFPPILVATWTAESMVTIHIYHRFNHYRTTTTHYHHTLPPHSTLPATHSSPFIFPPSITHVTSQNGKLPPSTILPRLLHSHHHVHHHFHHPTTIPTPPRLPPPTPPFSFFSSPTTLLLLIPT